MNATHSHCSISKPYHVYKIFVCGTSMAHVYGTRVHYSPSLGGTDLEAHAAVPPPKSGSAPPPPPPGVAPDDPTTAAIISLGTLQWLEVCGGYCGYSGYSGYSSCSVQWL